MADFQIGDRVVSVQSGVPGVPVHGAGRVDKVGTPESFDIPLSLFARRRDELVVHVAWDSGQSNYVRPEWLQVLPESLAPEDVERWLERG